MSVALQAPALPALLAAACYGAALVLTRGGLRHMTPLAGALVSVPSTTALFWLLAPFLAERGPWVPAALAIFGAVGLFFPALVTLLVFAANRHMGPTIAGTISSTTPVFAIAGALIFLGESLTAPLLAGTAGIVAGVAVLSRQGRREARTWPATALLLPLGAAGLRGMAQTAIKAGLLLLPSPFLAGLIGYSVSTVTVLLVALLRGQGTRRRMVRRGVPWFVAAGTCNGVAVLLTYTALRSGSVSLVAPIIAAHPLFALVLGLLLRQERARPRLLAGVVLIVLGVTLLLRRTAGG